MRNIDDPFWAGKGLVKSAAEKLKAEKDLPERMHRIRGAVKALDMQLGMSVEPQLSQVVANVDACLRDLGKSDVKLPGVVKDLEEAKASFEESMAPKKEEKTDGEPE